MGLQGLLRVPDPHSPSYPFMGVVSWDQTDPITEKVYSLLERKELFYTQSRDPRGLDTTYWKSREKPFLSTF